MSPFLPTGRMHYCRAGTEVQWVVLGQYEATPFLPVYARSEHPHDVPLKPGGWVSYNSQSWEHVIFIILQKQKFPPKHS